MRSAERALAASALVFLALSSHPVAGPLTPIAGQRYAMGTMFDIVVYHQSREEARRAIERALDEATRLDRVMSHYDTASELARLHREGRHRAVRVDAALYDVLREAIDISRRSHGSFDVTIAPLLRLWKEAEAHGSRPDAAAIARARRCVGYDRIELAAPDRVRLHSDCLSIDLGGIGKGYAVDRALDVLRRERISCAVVNAGGSSIGTIGAPPGRDGWPVVLGHGRTLLLNGTAMSTSLQDDGSEFGHIIDPASGAPVTTPFAVTVVAPSATLADALSTTLLVLPVEEGQRLLAGYDGVAAVWTSPDHRVHATLGASRLVFAVPD